MATCATSASEGLVRGVLDNVDCNIRVLVHDSYRDLLGPGTVFATAFTGLLTIYVALIGYQMVLGRGAPLTRLPVIALKVGLIMALLTSWAAYQALVFNLIFDGPREVLQAMLSPLRGAYPGFHGDLYDGVEAVYAALSDAAGAYGAKASGSANILQGGPMLGAGLLWFCAAGVLLSTVGLILACKIVLGFLLAVGPIFVGLFLFESTRGLFDGWLRTTLAVALAPLAATVFGVVMLLMLQPFVAALVENVSADVFDMGPIMTICLIVVVFMGILSMTLKVTAGLTGAFSTSRAPAETRYIEHEEQRDVRASTSRMSYEAAPGAVISGDAPHSTDDAAAAAARLVSAAAEASAPVATPLHERLGQSGRGVSARRGSPA